jgi:hypothetical protein
MFIFTAKYVYLHINNRHSTDYLLIFLQKIKNHGFQKIIIYV